MVSCNPVSMARKDSPAEAVKLVNAVRSALSDAGGTGLVIDASQVFHIDIHGFQVLLASQSACKATCRSFQIKSPSKAFLKCAAEMGLSHIVTGKG